MKSLHYPFQPSTHALTEIAGPKNAPLQWLSASWIRLSSQEPEARLEMGEREGVLDILGGLCSINVRTDSGSAVFPEIGGRANAFAGTPTMVYLPRGCRAEVFCESSTFEAALFTAPARETFESALIFPEEATTLTVGRDNWRRTVATSVGDKVRADRLIVGETRNPPGNWSSSPPHKHDVNSEDERAMEEVYLFKLNPPQGFGIQRIYSAPDDPEPFDVSMTVKDGDLVVIPRGYHPVVAGPGYQLLYVWALAGEERKYGAWTEDPAHAWIKGVKP